MSGKSDAERIRTIVRTTGLSEYSLRVHAAMMNKTHPLRVDTLFRVVCPNREIRSLCRDELNRLVSNTVPSPVAATGGDGDGSPTKKPVKKSDDDKRKLIIKEREKVLVANGVKIAGTVNARKKMPMQQKDLTLRWEFLGWGQTSANFFVYLYYVGPVDKGADYEELRRHENWHIVPESHLVLFHKHITEIHPFLHQNVLDVRETVDKQQHIEYDVRYILYKWRTCAKGTRKEMVALVNDNLDLFESKDTLRVKEHKRRKEQEKQKSSVVITSSGHSSSSSSNKRKRSSGSTKQKKTGGDDDGGEMVMDEPRFPRRKIYEVRAEKYRRIPASVYQNCVRYPLGADGIAFGVENIRAVMENALADEETRHPDSFEWDPVEQLVKPLMLTNDPVLFRRQLVTTLIKKYNLCCESNDFQLLYQCLEQNQAASDDIKQAFDSFAWACIYQNLITIKGMVPDDVEVV